MGQRSARQSPAGGVAQCLRKPLASCGRKFRSGWHDDGPREKWPTSALVIDCETTLDKRQNLTFGFFRYCRLQAGIYICVKEGLFYPDELEENDPKGFTLLQQYAESEAET